MSTSRKLNAAIKAENKDLVEKLLRDGAEPDASSCALAIDSKEHSILRALLRAGADPNALEPYWNRPPIIKALKLRR